MNQNYKVSPEQDFKRLITLLKRIPMISYHKAMRMLNSKRGSTLSRKEHIQIIEHKFRNAEDRKLIFNPDSKGVYSFS